MRTHTPGPWEISWHVAVDSAGRKKYRQPIQIGPIVVGDSPNDLNAANACLIAAAPDLLEAIKVLIVAAGDGHPGQDSYWAAVKAAESAVEKAEGKA